MVEILIIERKSKVLTSSDLACLSKIATINLTAGCTHGCRYCYTKGFSVYPGDGRVVIYKDLPEKLRDELQRRRKKPKAVYFSPSSDIFQPVREVLDLAYELLEILFENNISVTILTKGKIPTRHMSLLRNNMSLVNVQIGIITMNDRIRRLFEPNAASCAERISQIRQLIEYGIPTRARLDPIIPEFTDDETTLKTLFQNLSKVGIKKTAIAVLYLRPRIKGSIKQYLGDQERSTQLLAHFETGYRMPISAKNSYVTALSKEFRGKLFNRAQQIANSYAIETKICACKNPDIASECCGIAGNWQPPSNNQIQNNLFD
ncbi:radical SAM protein [Planctomycetota bacterium]